MSSISNIIRHSLKGTQKLHLHKYCICAINCRCSGAVYAASRMILIRVLQWHIICGIRCIICKVIAYSLKGMLKLCLHKYCIHNTNCIYKSFVYAVCVWTLIRAFQQDIICGIVLAISKVMACSFKGSVINCNSRVYSVGWYVSQTATQEPWRHMTVGRSYNQTGSDQLYDPPHDQSYDQVSKPVSNQSCDKECEHMLIHTYFCRCNL